MVFQGSNARMLAGACCESQNKTFLFYVVFISKNSPVKAPALQMEEIIVLS